MKQRETIVITGASAGVGRATARAFARQGAQIGLLARGKDALDGTLREVEDLGGLGLICLTDVADPQQVEAAAEDVERKFGPIDIWVNNAMATVFAPFEKVTAEEFKRATEVTYLGVVHGTKSALRRMKPRDRGMIVQVGSALAYRSIPLQSAYCGAKHAIVGFTDSIRSELIHDGSGVSITVVHLPAMNTPQFDWSRAKMPRQPQPVPPIFQPEVGADAIVWAAHHRRREVSVGAPTVLAIQGQKIAPGFGDRYLARNAYEAQQTQQPMDPNRADNLFSPVQGDFGAHGRFDARSSDRSIQSWVNRHRWIAGIGAVAATGAAVAFHHSLGDGSRDGHGARIRRQASTSLGMQSFLTGMVAGAIAAVAAFRPRVNRRGAIQQASAREPIAMPPYAAAQNRSETVCAWRGPALWVGDQQGRAGILDLSGFYFREARHLRDLRLELFGESPFLCSTAELNANELEFAFVFPEKKGGGSDRGGEEHGLKYRDLDMRLRYEVRPDGLTATLRIANRWLERAAVDIGWRLSADFADLSETAGERRQEAVVETICEPNGVRFRYMHPQLPLETRIVASGGGPWTFSGGRLACKLTLERHREEVIRLHVTAIDGADPLDAQDAGRRDQWLRQYQGTLTRVEAPGWSPLARIANHSMKDLSSLALLEGPPDEWLTPAAGIPTFPSLWGRDALTAAWQATMFDGGRMADAVLTRVGRLQGTVDDPWRDEQPGRTVRAAQSGPLARLNITPYSRYYGDYAGPFAFIFALGQLYAWSGNKRLIEKHWDQARRILDWARRDGDIDGDGYLEYKTRSKDGPKHQGWRDAENAVVYENGDQVEPPIATCEVQGYWFAAQQLMAVYSAVMGDDGDARAHWKASRDLKERFNRDFWMDSEGCVALGLDAGKRQIGSITSNAGQCLTTGVLSDQHIPRLVTRLFQPDMFSGWGIRTLSTGNAAYNPLGYHLGTVWPVENATMLFGLRRYGFDREATILARALYELALLWKGGRIPECVGGYSREEAGHPGAFAQANAPQTWNLSAFPILIQSLLGIQPVAPLNLIAIDPVLPEWAPELTLHNLRVGEASATVRFWRTQDGKCRYDVLEKQGTLHIVRQPPLGSLTVGIWDRFRALIH